jgi:hypothetical protein
MALVGLAQPQLSSFQLVKSAEANANVMGLIVMVGNGKRVTDNGRGYCNWMRITKPLNPPANYDKTELCPQVLFYFSAQVPCCLHSFDQGLQIY